MVVSVKASRKCVAANRERACSSTPVLSSGIASACGIPKLDQRRVVMSRKQDAGRRKQEV